MIKRICPLPFENIEIDSNGNVYTCCQTWINDYCIGNIYENSLEEIWNGDKAVELRQKILDDDYSICSQEYCNYAKGDFPPPNVNPARYKPVMDLMPVIVKLSYDKECNIACRICRDDVIKNTDEEQIEFEKLFNSSLLPALRNSRIITINAHGDPFGSRHSRNVIKKISETYPKIRFDFHTNATLCNLTLLKKMNVIDKIDTFRVSVSAVTAETYGKMVKNGEKLFAKLVSNLKQISELKKQKGFDFFLHFIVTSRNYTEMVEFIDFAETLGAVPCFWEFNFNCVSYAKNLDDSWMITNPKHPEYNNLSKLLKNKKFHKYRTSISPVLWNIISEG